MEFTAQIRDIEVRIKHKDEQIQFLKRDLEGSKYSNAALIENNAGLQIEIDSMNSHIRVISSQNDELTREID